ncbi:MAG: tRNA epoxyqueuosine(34) reductase QueG [Prevotella sp.]|jgi:epoxyqueuosine reductase|nr:tRNA epoxyqueuosine(34) reductase QueG [Prevotella sp.]
MSNRSAITGQIRAKALDLGFDACGFCRTESADTERERLKRWLDAGYHAGMDYMANYFEERCNPAKLVEKACSIVSLALNYYPARFQPPEVPQIAYYAYGQDYHSIMKAKLQQLFEYIQTLVPNVSGRCFCDTAPVLERYWAAKAGLGFIGKNTLLIIPRKGSYFFLGEIVLNIALDYDKPSGGACGNCRRCMDACPTKALEAPCLLDTRKCISYQTIENKGAIDETLVPLLGNRLYGCDACQQACPWNRFAQPHNTPEFELPEERERLSLDALNRMNEDDFRRIFKGSAMKRAKYSGLKRNAESLKKN